MSPDVSPDVGTAAGSDPAEWQQANDRYLAAALEWLRLLLRRRAYGEAPEAIPAVPSPSGSDSEPGRPAAEAGAQRWSLGRWWPKLTRTRGAGDIRRVSDRQLAAAAAAKSAAAETTPVPALVGLGALLGLSEFEQDTLLLCAARELDPAIGDLCAQAQGDPRLAYPTFALALSLFDNPAWDLLAPGRPLRYWRLIEISQPAGSPLVTSAIRADERVAHYLKGLNYLDDRLDALVTPVPLGAEQAAADALPASQSSVVDEVLGYWRNGVPVVAQLLGSDEAGKQLIAAHIASRLGLALYRMPAGLLPRQPHELDTLGRLWERESRLSPLALYLDAQETVEAENESAASAGPPVARFLARTGGAFLLATREARPDIEGPSITVDVAAPTVAERQAAWAERLGEQPGSASDSESGSESDPGHTIDDLAGQFALDVPTIRQVAAVSGGDPERAWRACLVGTRPGMGGLAQRLEPRVTWSDIVLPAEDLAVLRRIADQVAMRTTVYESWGFGERVSRGLGISALFTGPSGTGKTMAAEVLAHHLALDLYRIDLSAVVSKYVGETEKNLRRVFDVAERGGAILFFDEADALFGKRTETRDAHDRYANIETNFLLQRMEAYGGLAVLATNMRKALDAAFERRIRFIVEFKFPAVAERRAIWERVLPERAPRGRLDFDRLAQLPVSGGMIRNVALNAAFSAAGARTEITMPFLLEAARAEFKKVGLSIPERDLAWTEPQTEPAEARR